MVGIDLTAIFASMRVEFSDRGLSAVDWKHNIDSSTLQQVFEAQYVLSSIEEPKVGFVLSFDIDAYTYGSFQREYLNRAENGLYEMEDFDSEHLALMRARWDIAVPFYQYPEMSVVAMDIAEMSQSMFSPELSYADVIPNLIQPEFKSISVSSENTMDLTEMVDFKFIEWGMVEAFISITEYLEELAENWKADEENTLE